MYAPWVAHNYPGLTPRRMEQLRWSTYLNLWDALGGK